MFPREKFKKMGIDSLSDTELISVLVGSGIKGVKFSSLSRKILNVLKKGNLSYEDLRLIKGLGDVKSLQILCAIELGKRLYSFDNNKLIVSNTENAFNEVKYLVGKKQEYLVCLFLNARYELLKKKTIAIGTVDGLNISPRDIIVSALDVNAIYVILAHNHPSGVSEPSNEDLVVTEKLRDAMDLVGMKLLDHIVVASDGWKSIV